MLRKYGAFLDAMIEQGQSERAPQGAGDRSDARPRVPPEEPRNSAPAHTGGGPLGGRGVWYLVHHPVGPKFRVVFDGAAEFEGQALNRYLDKGPEHTSTLLGAFIRWRTYAKAACADIKGMFYNVSLPPEERDCVRYLWWQDGDPKKPVREYRLTHQVPGLTCSPSNACFVLRQLAMDNPTGASEPTLQSVRESFYVDDWLPSDPDAASLRRKIDEIRPLCSAAGFLMTKFAANDPLEY